MLKSIWEIVKKILGFDQKQCACCNENCGQSMPVSVPPAEPIVPEEVAAPAEPTPLPLERTVDGYHNRVWVTGASEKAWESNLEKSWGDTPAPPMAEIESVPDERTSLGLMGNDSDADANDGSWPEDYVDSFGADTDDDR